MNIGILDIIMTIKNLIIESLKQKLHTIILNDLDKQLFEKIFGHTFAELVDKLIDKIGEEENKIIIDNIKENRDKIYKQDECSNFVIQPTYKRGDLLVAIKIILNFNEVFH